MEREGRTADDAARFVAQLVADRDAPALPAAERAMLDYVVRLTTSPRAVRRADVEALRDAGFDDRAIHDICAIAAYYAFANRIADGLGVELEDRFRLAPGA